MKQLQILIGNIGNGKSTYCKKLAKQGYLIISKDDIRYSIGAGTYIFTYEYETAIDHAIKSFCKQLMIDSISSIIIDETNMRKDTRKPYLDLATLYEYNKLAVIFPKLPKEESVARRLKSNHGTISKDLWEEVWERKNSNYEPPTLEEGFNEIQYI